MIEHDSLARMLADVSTATDDGTTVTYTRDATDRIVARTAKSSEGQTTVVRYGYTGGSDTADLTLTGSNGLVERVLALPGGVVLTDRPDGQADVWAYPNIHGDVIVTADPTGTRQGPVTAYDPFGQPVDPTTRASATTTADDAVPDTLTGELDNGWLGQHQRPYEHAGTLATIEMGARQYVPTLGRFLQVDPIEGGTDNDYTYVTDPINDTDLDGQAKRCATRWCQLRNHHQTRMTVTSARLVGTVGLLFLPVKTTHLRIATRLRWGHVRHPRASLRTLSTTVSQHCAGRRTRCTAEAVSIAAGLNDVQDAWRAHMGSIRYTRAMKGSLTYSSKRQVRGQYAGYAW